MKKLLFSTLILGFFTFGTQICEAKNYYFKFNDKESKMGFYLETSLHSVNGEVRKFKGNINIKTVDDNTIKDADGLLEVNADSLFTNQNQRDAKMKNEILSVANFPLIKFKINSAKIMSNKIAEDNMLYLRLIGNLTIRDVTKNIEVPVKIKLAPDKSSAVVEGKYTVSFPDYNVPDPSLPIIGKVDPNINISFTIKAY